MNAIDEKFGKRKVFFPIIRVISEEQTRENIKIAIRAGGDGVFLINHSSIGYSELCDIYLAVKGEFPDTWIGINFLGIDTDRICELVGTMKVDGLWIDNVGIREEYSDPAIKARKLWESLGKHSTPPAWNGLYLGGVGFRYNEGWSDIGKVAAAAVGIMDVVLVVSNTIGEPPDLEKVRLAREAIGERPMAIANGITPRNVLEYLPYCDCFLVSSGIESPEGRHMLDFDSVKAVADSVGGYQTIL